MVAGAYILCWLTGDLKRELRNPDCKRVHTILRFAQVGTWDEQR